MSTSVSGRGSTVLLERAATGQAERDEDRLVAAVRCGDDDAFEVIYRRYLDRIGAYVRGLVGDHARAEDITQEVFLSALRRMRQTESQILLKPWLYEIAKNACIDHFRRTRRAEEVSFDADFQLAWADRDRLTTVVPGPDAVVDTKLRLDTLRGAFGSLSDIHHEILILRELEGRSYREIGERLGLTRPAVESTLFRARRRLVQEYDELDSGRSCRRVQGSMELASHRRLGTRDRRRMVKHLSHCAECRRHAALLGVGRDDLAATRRGAMARVAALLPWPMLFVRRLFAPGPGVRAARWSSGLSQTGDGAGMMWGKLVVSAVAVAAVSIGAAGPLPGDTHSGRHAHGTPPVSRLGPAPTSPRRHRRHSAAARRARRHARRVARERARLRAAGGARRFSSPRADDAAPLLLPSHIGSSTKPPKSLREHRGSRTRTESSRDSDSSLRGVSDLSTASGRSGERPLSPVLARVRKVARTTLQHAGGLHPRVAGIGEAKHPGRAPASGSDSSGAPGAPSLLVHSPLDGPDSAGASSG